LFGCSCQVFHKTVDKLWMNLWVQREVATTKFYVTVGKILHARAAFLPAAYHGKKPGGQAMVFYFVQRGDTLYTIAKRYQTTVHAIVVANRLEDPNAICPGQALIIPRPGEVPVPPPGGIVHLVRAGETVFHLAAKFGTPAHDILRANQIAHPEFILPGQQLVIPERMEAGDDWPMMGRTPGRAAAGPVSLSGPPTESWHYAPRKSLGVRPSAPVIRYDRVYVGLGDGQFYSLCRNTGRVKWHIPAAPTELLGALGDYALATPAIFDGLAYLCGPDGTVQAVDAYTGQHIWKTATGGLITSSPAVFGGVVYLGSWDGHLYAMEAKTGAVAWKRHLGAAIPLPVAIGDDHVYAVTADGALWAIDSETGETIWKVTDAVAAGIPPVFAEVVLLAGGRAYDPRNGQVVWEVDAGGTLPVARLDHVVYPGGMVDLFTGTLSTAPVAGARAEGSGVTTVVPPAPVPLQAHVVSGPLLIGVGLGQDAHLYAWEAATGQPIWEMALPVPATGPPAVAPAQVVVPLADGSVQTCRFDPEPPPETE
jgi:outer membrane protein assembly factor BamB